METGCPKCGLARDGAESCPRCGIVFDRYRPRAAALPRADAVPIEVEPETGAPKAGAFRRFYRAFRLVVLAACVLVAVLIFWRPPPPEVAADPQAPERLSVKLAEADLAVARREAHDLSLGEAELNVWLRRNLALAGFAGAGELIQPADRKHLDRLFVSRSPFPAGAARREPNSLEEARSNVRDLRVQLAGDLVRAYLVFDFHGRDLSLLLEGRLRAEDGYLRFVPTAALLGSLPLPRATLDRAVGRIFDDPKNRESFRLPPDVRDIRVEDGALVVSRN